MNAPTKNDANAAWVQQMRQMQQMQRRRKRCAQDGDIMMDPSDPQFVAPIGGVSGRRRSPRTTCPVSHADLPDDLVTHTDANDFLDDTPRSSAPRAVSTAEPAPHAIRTGVDAVNFLGTIAEDLKDPMASSHQ